MKRRKTTIENEEYSIILFALRGHGTSTVKEIMMTNHGFFDHQVIILSPAADETKQLPEAAFYICVDSSTRLTTSEVEKQSIFSQCRAFRRAVVVLDNNGSIDDLKRNIFNLMVCKFG